MICKETIWKKKKKEEFILEYRRQVIWKQFDVKLPPPPGPETGNRVRIRRLSEESFRGLS